MCAGSDSNWMATKQPDLEHAVIICVQAVILIGWHKKCSIFDVLATCCIGVCQYSDVT